MSIRAFAIVNDFGVMFRERQLLVFPRKKDADHALAQLLLAEEDEFAGRVERVSVDRWKRERAS